MQFVSRRVFTSVADPTDMFALPLSSAAKPFVNLRRKAQSFRQRQRECDFLKSSAKPSMHAVSSSCSGAAAALLDPNFSIDSFLVRLEKSIDLSELASRKPKTKKRTFTFEDLPAKVIIRILDHVSPDELLLLRLVSKSLDEVIQNHALELPKKVALSVDLKADIETGHILRIRRFRQITPLAIEDIDHALRHLQARQFNFWGLSVTPKVIRFLHRSIKYPVESLRFYNCHFLTSSSELAVMLRPWSVRHIDFNHCAWSPAQTPYDAETFFLDDRFVQLNRHLRYLVVDYTRMPEQRLGITDKIARIFVDLRRLPLTLVLRNCVTSISSKTLFAAVAAFIDAVTQTSVYPSTTSFVWSFGRVLESHVAVMSALQPLTRYVTVQEVTGDSMRLTFEPSPGSAQLFFSVETTPHSELRRHLARG